jgi:hypothetical protein
MLTIFENLQVESGVVLLYYVGTLRVAPETIVSDHMLKNASKQMCNRD